MIIGYEYCFQHLRSEKHLTIRQSTLPGAGLGLFAWLPPAQGNAIVFRQGDTICRYQGQIITNSQLNARYTLNGTAPYAIRESANRYNDAATKNIRAGQEIFLSYGPNYIMNQAGFTYRTVKRAL